MLAIFSRIHSAARFSGWLAGLLHCLVHRFCHRNALCEAERSQGHKSSQVTSSESEPLRMLQIHSLMSGGGTDEQCVNLARGLSELKQSVCLLGPSDRANSLLEKLQGVRFEAVGQAKAAAPQIMLRAARVIRAERIQIVHAHHGRDIWPTILAARLSGRRPKIVITRHMAKSPSSWFSRRFLLNTCDDVVAVAKFVQQVLCEGVDEP